MTAPKKYTTRIGKPEYRNKQKINIYLERVTVAQFERMAARKKILLHEEILSLIKDGLKYRNETRSKP